MTKDGRQQVCKSCKEQKEHHICVCQCDDCKDGKLLSATYSMMELVLTRYYEGLRVSGEFRKLVVELASVLLDEEEDNKNKKDS
jgi:hypothetical protein